MTTGVPTSSRFSFTSPELSFSHQSTLSIPLGADASTIRTMQLNELAKTERFLTDMGDKLRATQAQRPLTANEHAGLAQADAWRDQVRREQQGLRDQQALANCEKPSRHIANATTWRAECIEPDWCNVNNSPIAFDSFAVIDHERMASPDVKAQGVPVYRQGDLHQGMQADAGAQLVSLTSLGSGCVKILTGSNTVIVNNRPVARHHSECLINCSIMGVGGVKGQVVTEEKGAGSGAKPSQASNPEAPPGQRTSPRLEELKRQEEALKARMLNLDATDEYVRFGDLNKAIDGIQGTPGSWTDYLAQATRGLAKVGTGLGEGLYEGVKAIPKLAQRYNTAAGQQLTVVQAQMLAENIALGNVTASSVGGGLVRGAVAIVVPPAAQSAWTQGNYLEATTNVIGNAVTLGAGALKGGALARGAGAAEGAVGALDDAARAAAGGLDDAAKSAAGRAAAGADDAARAVAGHADEAAAAGSVDDAAAAAGKADDPVHVKPRPKLDPLDVPCFHPYDKPNYLALKAADRRKYLEEYAKQLRRQEEQINKLSANDFNIAREAYKAAGGRNPVANALQGQFRKDFIAKLQRNIFASLRSSGMGAAEAKAAAIARAKEIADPLAALHEPDMVTGGFHEPNPKHMGRTDVNSSIGGSWNQGDRLSSMDGAANDAIANGKGNANMNVQLRLCPGKR